MRQVVADMHTHTLASTHAYSTLLENADYAREIGLHGIGFTDHGPLTPDSPHIWHAASIMHTIPESIHGIRIYRGVEASLTDFKGGLDVPKDIYSMLEWVIASCHSTPTTYPSSIAEMTDGWLAILNDPYVDLMGHSGTPKYEYDYDTVAKEAAKLGKIIEINSHSFVARRGAKQNCRDIARMCKKHGTYISINSDAHFAFEIGRGGEAYEMLDEIGFPDELVLNNSVEKLEKYFAAKKERLALL